jgi:hypothetical protein
LIGTRHYALQALPGPEETRDRCTFYLEAERTDHLQDDFVVASDAAFADDSVTRCSS